MGTDARPGVTGQFSGGMRRRLDLAMTLLGIDVVLGVALLIGYRPAADLAQWIAAIAMVLMLLPLLGSGFVPAQSLPVALGWFAENQSLRPSSNRCERCSLVGRSDRPGSSPLRGALRSGSQATCGRGSCTSANRLSSEMRTACAYRDSPPMIS